MKDRPPRAERRAEKDRKALAAYHVRLADQQAREATQEAPSRKGEYLVPEGKPVQTCDSCGAQIVWTRTRNKKPIPLSVATIERREGIAYALSHFADCPDAKGWSKKR